MSTVREQFIQINKRIFNLRDGEILKIQKEYGTTYRKSMGVAIISIETIAKDYVPSHELAKLLWEFNGREQTIMAALLEEPEKIEISELETHLKQTQAPELWEQVTKSLIRKLPNLNAQISRWLESDNEILHAYAILSLGYFSEYFSEEILSKIMKLPIKEDSYSNKCINRILLKIGIKNSENFQILSQNKLFQQKFPELQQEISSFF